MSSGITPVAAPKATRPEPAGKLMPIGKRVWLSPPVPTVSGSSMRLSQLWMTPSPGRSADAAAVADELGQLAVHLHVHRLRVGRGVAERLHHQVGTEAQAGQVLQLVAGHRAGGVLRADAWSSSARSRCRGERPGLPAGRQARPTIFCASVKPWPSSRPALPAGGTRWRPAGPGTSRALAVERAADDEVDAAAGAHFVEQHVALELELGDDLRRSCSDLALVRAACRSRRPSRAWSRRPRSAARRSPPAVLKKIGAILPPRRHAAEALVRHEGDVLAGGPDARCWWPTCGEEPVPTTSPT